MKLKSRRELTVIVQNLCVLQTRFSTLPLRYCTCEESFLRSSIDLCALISFALMRVLFCARARSRHGVRVTHVPRTLHICALCLSHFLQPFYFLALAYHKTFFQVGSIHTLSCCDHNQSHSCDMCRQHCSKVIMYSKPASKRQ